MPRKSKWEKVEFAYADFRPGYSPRLILDVVDKVKDAAYQSMLAGKPGALITAVKNIDFPAQALTEAGFAGTLSWTYQIRDGLVYLAILCADDHDDTREMIACWLDLCGYEVTTTDRISETLPLTERGAFDLLLLSGWYRDGLGVDLCRQIRAFDARTPIVFLSAYAYATDIKEGLESGAQAYFTKPVDLNTLRQTIEQFVFLRNEAIPQAFAAPEWSRARTMESRAEIVRCLHVASWDREAL